jgi:hypothetical protein
MASGRASTPHGKLGCFALPIDQRGRPLTLEELKQLED